MLPQLSPARVAGILLGGLLFCGVLTGGVSAMATPGPVPGNHTTATVTIEPLAGATPHAANTPLVTGDRQAITNDQRQPQVSEQTIDLQQVFIRTPDRPGEYTMRHAYQLPAGLASYELTIPTDATVINRNGFVRDATATYSWDGQTTQPTLTYRVPADRTRERDDPIAAPGEYLFVDRGEWGLVTRPSIGHSWSWTGRDVALNRTATVEGPGAASEVMAFLGAHDTYTHQAHGQTFRLIVPEQATLREDPATIFETLSVGADRLQVGDRDDTVFIIAAPTDDVPWGVRGLQTGPADMWVRDFEPVAEADNVWLHEYVHTRQGYTSQADLQWFTEASAVYYAALLTLEQGAIEYEQFRDRLATGTNDRFEDARLVEPSTWEPTNANYHTGPLVLGALDRQLRLTTEQGRSLQAVFTRLNAAPDTVSANTFEAALDSLGDTTLRDLARKYTSTTTRPSTWDRAAHIEAFGVDPARFQYTIETVSVAGTDRSSVVTTESPLRVGAGETVTLTVRIRNAGGTAGTYQATVFADGQPTETRTGTLAPGETTTHTIQRTFDERGEYTMALGPADLRVSVREHAVPDPGFTVLSAIGVLILIALLVGRRRE